MDRTRTLWIDALLVGSLTSCTGGHVGAAPKSPFGSKATAESATSGAASATNASTAYFLSANPHVPLALVRGAEMKSAVDLTERGKTCGPRNRWSTKGSRWRAVDGWGQIVGTFTVNKTDHYDVTGCYELYFASPPANHSTLLFVSEDSAWTPPASVEWRPSAAERASFNGLLDKLPRGQDQTELSPRLTEVTTDARYFEVPSAGGKARMAVGGRCGAWVVASLVKDTWVTVTDMRQPKGENRICSRPLAVFDMTGDGVPEIVLRFIEHYGEWWGEIVLQRSSAGDWTEVAMSPGGSTA